MNAAWWIVGLLLVFAVIVAKDLTFPALPKKPARKPAIMCVGDSITYGYTFLFGLRRRRSYPGMLQGLRPEYEVINLGLNGRTAVKHVRDSYWKNKFLGHIASYDPKIVIVMLGTNDSKERIWNGKETYMSDYRDLIAHISGASSKPDIYIMTSPGVLLRPGRKVAFGMQAEVVAEQIVPAQKELARALGLGLIDLNAELSGQDDCYSFDGIHPNRLGYKTIARLVHSHLPGKSGE